MALFAFLDILVLGLLGVVIMENLFGGRGLNKDGCLLRPVGEIVVARGSVNVVSGLEQEELVSGCSISVKVWGCSVEIRIGSEACSGSCIGTDQRKVLEHGILLDGQRIICVEVGELEKVVSVASGLSLAIVSLRIVVGTDPLEMDEVSLIDDEVCWEKVVFESGEDLDNVSSLPADIYVINVLARVLRRRRLNGEHVGTVLESPACLRGVVGERETCSGSYVDHWVVLVIVSGSVHEDGAVSVEPGVYEKVVLWKV